MSNDKRYRVTVSRYIYAESDEQIQAMVKDELHRENISGDSHPHLISIEEIEFGSSSRRELRII